MEPVSAKSKEDEDFEPQQRPSSWHRPPVIQPNYRSRSRSKSLIPKSKVQHVLLHDNKNQKNILNSRLSYLNNDFKRSSRMFELHKRSFLIRQSMKQVGLWERGINHVELLPETVVGTHCPGTSRKEALQHPMARRRAETTRQLQRRYSLPLMENPASKFSRIKSFEMFETVAEEGDRVHNNLKNTEAAQNLNQNINDEQINSNVNKSNNKQESVSVNRLNSQMSETDRAGNSSKQLLRREKTTSSMAIPLETTPNVEQSRPTNFNRKRKSGIQRQLSGGFDRSKSAMPLQPQPNLTKSFSTYNHSNRREVTIHNPHRSFAVATEDPRFQDLKNHLIPSEKPIDGFLQLSPGGRKVIKKYGGSLYDESELRELLDKYNSMNFMSSKRIQSAHMKMRAGKERSLGVREAFVDDASLYSSLAHSTASLVLSEAE